MKKSRHPNTYLCVMEKTVICHENIFEVNMLTGFKNTRELGAFRIVIYLMFYYDNFISQFPSITSASDPDVYIKHHSKQSRFNVNFVLIPEENLQLHLTVKLGNVLALFFIYMDS